MFASYVYDIYGRVIPVNVATTSTVPLHQALPTSLPVGEAHLTQPLLAPQAGLPFGTPQIPTMQPMIAPQANLPFGPSPVLPQFNPQAANLPFGTPQIPMMQPMIAPQANLPFGPSPVPPMITPQMGPPNFPAISTVPPQTLIQLFPQLLPQLLTQYYPNILPQLLPHMYNLVSPTLPLMRPAVLPPYFPQQTFGGPMLPNPSILPQSALAAC